MLPENSERDTGARATAESSLNPDDLRAAVGELLGVELSAADDDSNLFELGLQSLSLMRLAGRLNRSGAEVKFAQLSEDPRLSAWFALLAPRGGDPVEPRPQGPVESEAGPEVATDRAFPLTAVQQAYLIGRADDQPLGGVSCHAYLEFDAAEVDPERLEKAVRVLVERHPMLRVAFTDDATQRVLPESP